jgi:hypothetical protein
MPSHPIEFHIDQSPQREWYWEVQTRLDRTMIASGIAATESQACKDAAQAAQAWNRQKFFNSRH